MADIMKDLSIKTQNARHQIGLAIALITILPALATLYFSITDLSGGLALWQRLTISVCLLGGIALGYLILSRYPSNISRLRKYLEDMVDGRMPDKVQLIQSMGDIPAIEHSLRILIEQLSGQVTDMRRQMAKIDGLINRPTQPSFWKRDALAPGAFTETATHGDATCRFILDAVGGEILKDFISDLVSLLETSAFCFEENGDVACHVIVSDWCRCLTEAGHMIAAQSGGATRHDPCIASVWQEGGRNCIASGLPNDLECRCGMRAFLAPIIVRNRAVGVIGFTYGIPPTDSDRLRSLERDFKIPYSTLEGAASRYEERPPFIVGVTKNRLHTAARLLGEIIDRKQIEQSLLRSQEELRKHRSNLELVIEERTAELQKTNELLGREVEERRSAERLKDEFVGTVSHELRTPLAVTKEGIGLLLDGIAGPITEKQRKVLTTARNNVDRLARIINDLLDISKIEAGKMEIRRAALDLSDLVRQACALMESLAARKGILLVADVPPEPRPVFADSDRIMQVLTNLIGNAIRFTTSGSVRVFTVVRDLEIECSVQDTGPGIAPQDMPMLFQKFVQLHRVEGAGQRGTGLGLVICKSIVELHRGRIWAHSRPGEGATFTFTLRRYVNETLAQDVVDEAIAECRVAHHELLLMLLRFESTDANRLPFAEAETEKAALRVLQSSVTRANDRIVRLGDRDILLSAHCREGESERLRSLWNGRLDAAANGLTPPLCGRGWAVYPVEGLDANELLAQAEKRIAISQQPA